jgi:hypothetical protein
MNGDVSVDSSLQGQQTSTSFYEKTKIVHQLILKTILLNLFSHHRKHEFWELKTKHLERYSCSVVETNNISDNKKITHILLQTEQENKVTCESC